MKKFNLIWIFAFLISLTSAYATGGDAQFGTNYSITSGYIAFTRFNQSDSTTIENLATGQAWVEQQANPNVTDNMLIMTDASLISQLRLTANLSKEGTKNYTIDWIYRVTTNAISGATLEFWGGNDCTAGPPKLTIGSEERGDGLNDILGVRDDTTHTGGTPNINVKSVNETTILARINVNATGEAVNVTWYNFTVNSNGVITTNQISTTGWIAVTTGINAVGCIRFVFDDLDSSTPDFMNVTEFAIYNGTVRPAAAAAAADTTPPIVNTTFNITSPKINDYINISANITDETGLSFCQFIDNQSLNNGAKTYFNKSVSGTSDKCSQNYTIRLTRGNVINFTVRVNDTSNNFKMNDTIITVADTTPTFTLANNNTNAKVNEVVQLSALVSDADTLSMIIASWNGTGAWSNVSNITLGSTANNYTVNLSHTLTRGSTIGWLFYSNDSVVSTFTASTLSTFVVADATPTHTSPLLNSSNGLNDTNTNLTGFNQSGSDVDSDQIVFNYRWYKNNVKNATRFIDDGSLVLYLPFDETSTKDFSGNKNDGIANNGITGTLEGKVNDAEKFDGINDFLQVNINISKEQFNILTFSFWVFNNNNTDENRILFTGTQNSDTFYLAILSNFLLSFGVNDSANTYSVGTNIPTREWVNIIITFNRTNYSSNGVYVEGWVNGKFNMSLRVPDTWVNSSGMLKFGASVSSFLKGSMDEIAIWNRTLSPSEIQQIYQGTRNDFANLDSSQTEDNDNWTIEMTPYDVTGKGTPLNSTSLTIISDITVPVVNVSINNTSPKRYELINISTSITDGNGLLSANITINKSTGKEFYNYTLSGTSATISNITNITDSRGNILNITVYATDTSNNVQQNSTLITVANTAPSFTSSSITQTVPNTTTTLTGTTSGYSDPDSDAESGSTYKWYKNTVAIAGETTTSLADTNFIRNDAIIFEATPSDGTGSGSPVNSSSVTIVDSPPFFNIVTNNSAPKINEVVKINGNTTDNDIISMIIFSWNGSSSGLWINVSNTTASSTGLNYSVNVTIGLSRGNTIGWLFYSNDSVVSTFTASALNTFTVANTVGSIAIGTNGTSFKINGVINASGNITEPDGDIAFGMVAHNQSGAMVNTTFAGSGNNFNFSQVITITLARGNVINFTTFYNDTAGTSAQSSTMITVANTIPNATNFVNTTGLHRTTNLTINWTASFDGDTTDGTDTLNYVLYSDTSNPPTTLVSNSTKNNFTTKWTSDNTYFFQIKVMDGQSESALSSVFNLTLDTGLPILTINITNNTFTRFNQSILFSIEDAFPYNLSIRIYSGSSQYYLNTSANAVGRFINISGLFNLTQDGNYTIEINASDSDKSSPIISDKLSPTKIKTELLSMNDSQGRGVNLDIKFKNGALPPNLTSFAEYNSKGTHIDFGVNYTANATDLLPIFNVKSNGIPLDYLNDSIKGHFVFFPYGIDFEGKFTINNIVKNYDANIKKISDTNYQIQIIPNTTINIGDNITFASHSVFGLNLINIFNTFVVDQTAPTFANAFNRTADSSNSTSITTGTSANACIDGLDDLYLDRGNFSDNASSGNWNNHSITIIGNRTRYCYSIGSGNFTANQVVGWKFYVYDLAGNLLDPIYTFSVSLLSIPVTTTTTSSDDETTIVTSGSGGGGGGGGGGDDGTGTTTPVTKPPIEAFVPQVWLTEQSIPVNIMLYKNNTLYDPLKIEFEFKPNKNNIIYENLTKNSIGNYTASFYVLPSAKEGKYGLIIKVTSSPTETIEIPFEIKKSNLVEFVKERGQDVKRIIEKVTGSNKEKLTGWQIGLIIGGTVFAILMLIMFGLLLSKIGSKEKPKVKTREYY